jgi:two-component system, cell cycle sensor histidine kinase and response regulator CckA
MVTCPDPLPDYPSASEPDSLSDRKGGTILIVDDDEMLLNVMTEMLGFLGHHVIRANSGDEALSIYQRGGDHIDLVVLDIMMPRMTGDVLFDRLKEMDPQVKVVCASGYCSRKIIEKMLAEGCYGYFPKPINFKDLAKHISRILKEDTVMS